MTYREIMQKEGREIEPIVYYYNDDNDLIEISRDDFISSKLFFNTSLVGTVMNGINIELKKELPNKEIFLKVIAKYGTNNTEKIYGPYYKKEDATYNADSKSYIHTLYDKLLTTMVDYKAITITYPTTVLDFFHQLCKECNFTTNITELPNGNKVINNDIYDGINFTYRDVLTDIGQATATLFKIDGTEIIKCELGKINAQIDDDILKNQNIDFGEHYGPINSIVLSRSADSDSIYKRDEKLTSWNEFKISDNQLMNDNNRSDYLEAIYNALYGIEYDIFDCQLVGYGGFDALEKIEIQTLGEDGYLKKYNSYVFNNEQTITQGYSETIYAELPTKINTNYKASDTTDKRINQAYAILDKQNKKFEVLVSDVNENTEKVASLEITTGNISTKVSSVENSLSTTNTNLSNLSNTVDTLSNDIDGVSADFEEFKDNEYIQSIDNLQKQIDGAIQFWNGAEIPTINNYPANQWTTENDKINHQADIYTVVQDIEGEMKQGKSYRFDKIDGVWQWIELTDNELSAVQAIAQEALNKAKANANEIGTIKTRVSSLEQTDEQIKASVESIDKQIIPTASVADSNIYVEDASDNPLVLLEIEGKSEQATRSGKNKLNITSSGWTKNGLTLTIDNNKLTFNGTATAYTEYYLNINAINFANETTYILSLKEFGGTISGVDGETTLYNVVNGMYLKSPNISIKKTMTSDASINQILIAISSKITFSNYTYSLQLEEGSTATEYEQYGVSPSPDYPSEIESVGYENLYDENIPSSNYYYDQYGEQQESTLSYKNQKITDIFRNMTFSFKKLVNGTSGSAYVRVCEYNENNVFIKRTLVNINKTTLLLDSNTNYIIVSVDDHPSNGYIEELQIEKGSIAHSYIPFGKYGIEVKTFGKNKFDEEFARVNSNYVVNSNIGSSWKTITIDLLPETEYTITRFADSVSTNGGFNLQFYLYEDTTNPLFYVNNATAETVMNRKTVTFTTGESGKIYLAHLYGTDERLSDLFNNIDLQIEEGNVSTKLEEFGNNKCLLVLNEPLRSLPNGVKDIAYIKNNKLYVDRYVESIVLNGSEEWGSTANNQFYSSIIMNLTKGASSLLSNYFIDIKGWGEKDGIFIGSYGAIGIINTKVDTIEAFKTWLSTHNTQVDYELAEPYTEELDEIEMPSTFKGVNHISTTDDLEPTLNIEYVRDTTLSNYVEGQINKVMTIEERHYSELVIEDDLIKESVTEISSNLSDMSQDVHTVQETLTSTEKTLEVISTNIDKTTGEIREVTTINGYKFNKDGLNIYTNENSFNTLIDNEGTYYKDGDAIISETTKDGFMATSIKNKGSEEYCYDESNKVYDFVKERIEVDGEYGYATFYNGVN